MLEGTTEMLMAHTKLYMEFPTELSSRQSLLSTRLQVNEGRRRKSNFLWLRLEVLLVLAQILLFLLPLGKEEVKKFSSRLIQGSQGYILATENLWVGKVSKVVQWGRGWENSLTWVCKRKWQAEIRNKGRKLLAWSWTAL